MVAKLWANRCAMRAQLAEKLDLADSSVTSSKKWYAHIGQQQR